MPSHTFTRVGDWQASINANIASIAAARREGSTAEELHASDYLMEARVLGDESVQHVGEFVLVATRLRDERQPED